MSSTIVKEPVCFSCAWLIYYPYCLAYPNGIPQDIRLGISDHNNRIIGDGDYTFTPKAINEQEKHD